MYIGLHVKCLLFLPEFHESWTVSTYFRKILKYHISLKPFQWDLCFSMRTDRRLEGGRTDREIWRNSCLTQIFKCVQKVVQVFLTHTLARAHTYTHTRTHTHTHTHTHKVQKVRGGSMKSCLSSAGTISGKCIYINFLNWYMCQNYLIV